MNKRDSAAVFAFTSLILVSAKLFAQDLPHPTPAPSKEGQDQANTKSLIPGEPIKAILVKGTFYNAQRDDTAAKSVIGPEELNRYGDLNIVDALKRVPGVTVEGGRLQLRGLGSGYTQVLINGERPPRGFSLEGLSPEMVGRVEIFRVASAEFSTQAVAGTINLVLKKASQPSQKKIKTGIAQEYKPSFNVDWQTAGKSGVLSYNLGLAARSGGSVFGAPRMGSSVTTALAGDELRNVSFESAGNPRTTRISLLPSFTWDISDGTSISSESTIAHLHTANTMYERQHAQFGEAAPIENSDRDTVGDVASASTSVQIDKKLDDGAKLSLNASIDSSWSWRESSLVGFNGSEARVLRRNVDDNKREYGVNMSGKYRAPIVAKHEFVLGASGSMSTSSNQNHQLESRLDQAAPTLLAQNSNAKVSNLALFSQDEWTIRPGFSIYAGLRWEGVQVDSEGTNLADSRYRSGVWSPILQTLFRLPSRKGDQVRLGLARTYKLPDLSLLITPRENNLNNSPTEPNFEGNPALRPELAWALEAAFEHSGEDKLNYNLRAYIRTINDLNVLTSSGASGNWIAKYENDGRAKSVGIEFDVQFPVNKISAAMTGTDIRASFARRWSSVTSAPGPDNRLEPSTLIFDVGVDHRTPTHPMTAGFHWRIANGGWRNINSNQREYSVSNSALDGYAAWKFDKKTQLRLSVSKYLHANKFNQTEYTYDNGDTNTYIGFTPSYTNLKATLEFKY